MQMLSIKKEDKVNAMQSQKRQYNENWCEDKNAVGRAAHQMKAETGRWFSRHYRPNYLDTLHSAIGQSESTLQNAECIIHEHFCICAISIEFEMSPNAWFS